MDSNEKEKVLVYWVARIKNDNACYNCRGRTMDEVLEQIKGQEERYEIPRLITIKYHGVFDLVFQLLGEGGNPETWLPDLETGKVKRRRKKRRPSQEKNDESQ